MACLFCSEDTIDKKEQLKYCHDGKRKHDRSNYKNGKDDPSTLTCSKCGCCACYDCLSKIMNLIEREDKELSFTDSWCINVKDFLQGCVPSNQFVGHCCEMKEEKFNFRNKKPMKNMNDVSECYENSPSMEDSCIFQK